ncbi:divergent polysaccharide deacetylase family protein [Desulfoluna butyratoxydans]|uniref:Glycoside hydrolase/deacetylase beta/alpha-barrel n=1 Tax=Desulfoluna butyratoxydans TaxID=231438 RepID=A0A4U8YIR6_9BACT|nr:divergent polysaccharide deacetylase family protein [Desulfoluna butyratoxydans]VFQ43585.1 glycoside hydrolase/deacetylase beta/alpha-barrel [Desulfoluna butyratoxydans]
MAGAKKKKKKGSAKAPSSSSFGRVAFAISLVACIVVVSGLLLIKYLPPRMVPQKHAAVRKSDLATIPPQYEVFEKHAVPDREERPVVPPAPHKPTLVLIIDDIGYSESAAYDLMALDSNITLSILPGSPHGKDIAGAARKKGMELMLHQPMEPNEYPRVDPGPGALFEAMDPDQLLQTLEANLTAYPGVKGVNNHMGSRLTSLSPQMYQVMTLLKQKGLYFIDSRTSSKTVSRSAARLMQVPFAERDVFLDHVQSREAVVRQVKKMLAIAEKHGSAVGIGHPHKVTCTVLAEMMPEIHRRVTLVRPSALVAQP